MPAAVKNEITVRIYGKSKCLGIFHLPFVTAPHRSWPNDEASLFCELPKAFPDRRRFRQSVRGSGTRIIPDDRNSKGGHGIGS